MVNLIIAREDVNNSIHPRLFDDWCEDLGLDPDETDTLDVFVVAREEKY